MGSLINEILARLKLITALQFVTVWNNQFEYMENGESYLFPMPCGFVQIESDNNMDIGGNFQGSDLNITIHLGQNVLNGDLMDENLTIFDLRDLVIKSMATFKPTKTGLMTKISEGQDFDHTNIYHYEIKYKTHFIDDVAVPQQYFTTPPINANITIA